MTWDHFYWGLIALNALLLDFAFIQANKWLFIYIIFECQESSTHWCLPISVMVYQEVLENANLGSVVQWLLPASEDRNSKSLEPLGVWIQMSLRLYRLEKFSHHGTPIQCCTIYMTCITSFDVSYEWCDVIGRCILRLMWHLMCHNNCLVATSMSYDR